MWRCQLRQEVKKFVTHTDKRLKKRQFVNIGHNAFYKIIRGFYNLRVVSYNLQVPFIASFQNYRKGLLNYRKLYFHENVSSKCLQSFKGIVVVIMSFSIVDVNTMQELQTQVTSYVPKQGIPGHTVCTCWFFCS